VIIVNSLFFLVGWKIILSELSLSDEWETPKELFDYLCKKYNFYPYRDVCATKKNKKCIAYFDKKQNGLNQKYNFTNWCNPPHSETENFVKKSCWEFLLSDFETMMIIPANSICTNYSLTHIIGIAEFYPIIGKINFLHYGNDVDRSRNCYFVVIWRKKN